MIISQNKTQTGISLIELLVTLVISSLLLLAVSKIYIDNRKSYLFQQNKSENQENHRYTFLMLHQNLTKTGFRRQPELLMETVFPSYTTSNCGRSTCPAFSQGGTIIWQSATSQYPWSLYIRYQPRDAQDRDCLGNLPKSTSVDQPYTDPKEIIIERYWHDTSSETLKCQVVHYKEGVVSSDLNGELITGILNFHFDFGISNNKDGKISNYKSQDQMGSEEILSIRYTALTVSSNSYVRDGSTSGSQDEITQALSKWTALLGLSANDTSLAAIKQSDEGQLYQVLQNTVALRNLLR